MRVIIQKSRHSSVSVDGKVIGSIDKGFVLLVGVTHEDTQEDVDYCAKKIAKMRLFEDEAGKTNLSLDQLGGSILSISQFSLYANTKKGNRPSFIQAANPEYADQLYRELNNRLRQAGYQVEEGQFGADMLVSIENDGPMTIILDSKNRDL